MLFHGILFGFPPYDHKSRAAHSSLPGPSGLSAIPIPDQLGEDEQPWEAPLWVQLAKPLTSELPAAPALSLPQ